MSKNPLVNFVDSLIVWLPLLAIVVGIGWVACYGLASLEIRTNGTEVFVSNRETPNVPPHITAHPVNTTSEAGVENMYVDAMATGDVNGPSGQSVMAYAERTAAG